MKVFDGKFLSKEENQIHGLCREEEPTHSSSLDLTPARLEDSRDSPQGPRERRSTAELTHARMLQLQELGLAATVTNTLVSLKDLPKRANLKLGWIQCQKSICLLEEKQYAVLGYTRLRKTNTELSIASKVAWWQNDTFAPVGDKVILRFVLSFALHLGYELYQLDIDTAYLYGNLKETTYMIQPEGFDDGSGRVCLLKSASMA